jgi:hypothetical protein
MTAWAADAQQIRFPEDYTGTWAGTLHMFPSGQRVEMSLQIGPKKENSGRYDYILTYHTPGGDDRREYELEQIPDAPDRFRVDEKNSIVLEERLLGNALISIFSVSGTSLIVTAKLEPEKIIFEVMSWDEAKKTESGGKENVPVVYSFLSNGYQRAELFRKSK